MKICSSVFLRCCVVVALTVSVLVAVPRVTQAYFMDVLSQAYSIQGEGYVYDTPPGGFQKAFTVSYNLTADHPVSFQEGVYWYDTPAGNAGGFQIDSNARGEVTSESAWVGVSAYFQDESMAVAQFGSASASITFSPLVDTMEVIPYHPGDGVFGAISITDITDGSPLFLLAGTSYSDFYFNGTWVFPVTTLAFNLDHVYAMSVEASRWGNFIFSDPFSVRLEPIPETPVPEPSTLLLLASGLAGVGGLAWQRHRRG